MRSIFLIGLMGAGKTTVGRHLADRRAPLAQQLPEGLGRIGTTRQAATDADDGNGLVTAGLAAAGLVRGGVQSRQRSAQLATKLQRFRE